MGVVKLIVAIYESADTLGSFLMKSFLRLNGAKIGKNTYVSFSSRVIGIKGTTIGDDSKIKGNAKIKAGKIKIGHNCIISDGCYITGSEDFTIGNKSYIGKNVRINVSKEVKIGDDVGIAEGSKIFTHGFFPPADEGYPVTYAPVEIGDNTWISSNSIILPRVKIGKDVIIGPGTVITKSITENSIISGNPAKFITNTSKLRSLKPFLEVLENIFKEYPEIEFIEKKAGILKYKLKNKIIYVLEGKGKILKSFQPQEESIIIFKNIENPTKYKRNNIFWFDLTKKEMTSKKAKEVPLIQSILRANGIRLLKIYQ